MSETLVRLRYFAVVCLISSYYLVCYYHVCIMILNTVCTRARLRAVSASNANAWLRAIPCIHNDLALEPQEMQVLLKWWLGLPVFSADSKRPFC